MLELLKGTEKNNETEWTGMAEIRMAEFLAARNQDHRLNTFEIFHASNTKTRRNGEIWLPAFRKKKKKDHNTHVKTECSLIWLTARMYTSHEITGKRLIQSGWDNATSIVSYINLYLEKMRIMKLSCERKADIRNAEFLAADEARKAAFWPTPNPNLTLTYSRLKRGDLWQL